MNGVFLLRREIRLNPPIRSEFWKNELLFINDGGFQKKERKNENKKKQWPKSDFPEPLKQTASEPFNQNV